MANIIEAFNNVFTEEYALAKLFIYAIPVFICLNAYASGQFVLSGVCGLFAGLLILGLLTCGINSMRENKREILTLNAQYLIIAIVKTAVVVVPQVSISAMIAMFIKELIPVSEEMSTQIPAIINIIVWGILISVMTTSYLSFTRHMDIKEAYNLKVIFESVVDVFVNLVFFGIQIFIVDTIFVGMMSYVFTVLNLLFTHPAFIFYCSLLIIINVSIMADMLSQASYECIKGKDDDYKDRYKIGSTLTTANFSGGIAVTPSGAAPFTPGGITTSGSVSNNPPAPSRAEISRNHLNKSPRNISGRGIVKTSGVRPGVNRGSRLTGGRPASSGRSTINRNVGGSSSGSSNNAPKKSFGNNRRPGSGFGNNRNVNRFGNKKNNDGGGLGGFFKKK